MRTFLLKSMDRDWFNQIAGLGGDAVVRAYWIDHAAMLLAEFAETHVCDSRPSHQHEGECRPLGWWLYDAQSPRNRELDEEAVDEDWDEEDEDG